MSQRVRQGQDRNRNTHNQNTHFHVQTHPYKRLPEVSKYNHEIVGLANRLMAES
jgi:hypothetical protein